MELSRVKRRGLQVFEGALVSLNGYDAPGEVPDLHGVDGAGGADVVDAAGLLLLARALEAVAHVQRIGQLLGR